MTQNSVLIGITKGSLPGMCNAPGRNPQHQQRVGGATLLKPTLSNLQLYGDTCEEEESEFLLIREHPPSKFRTRAFSRLRGR